MKPAMPAALKTADLKRSNCDSLELNNRVSNRFTHPSDLTVAPFTDRDLQDSRAKLRDSGRQREPIIQFNSFAQFAQSRSPNCPANDLDPVGLGNSVARMHEEVGEFAVIGKEQKPAAADVETTDWVEP
jgi:hypothetical protein